jgi:hypothetical protein
MWPHDTWATRIELRVRNCLQREQRTAGLFEAWLIYLLIFLFPTDGQKHPPLTAVAGSGQHLLLKILASEKSSGLGQGKGAQGA